MAIPNATVTHHHIGEVQQEFKAGIRSEDFPHLADLLINLYSNREEAVLREYSTNALDSHIAAGNPDPIQVTLPSSVSPELVIQDYGIGLSIDDLRDVYSMYGRSLKRDSNAFVGQLGLGCKSGLTYADKFTITAVKDGVKCAAESTKDAHGVGVIRVIDTCTTDEPNGVRITIPVRERDIRTFRSLAEELFQFWDEGTVLVNGKVPEVPEWRKQALALDDDTWIVPMNTLWSSYVVMGNVAYEVPDAVFGPSHQRQTKRFVARVNIGDIDFVPSREAIKNTEWTLETLRDLNAYIGTHFHRVLSERLAKCPTRWDETQLKVLWRGSGIGLNASQQTPIWTYEPRGWGRKARAHTSYRYSALTQTQIVVVTGFPNKSLSPVHRQRLEELAPTATLFVVVPQSTDTSGLSGRGNTYTWEDVVGATADPSSANGRTARGKRAETRYTISGGGSMTAAELAALGTKVLYLYPKESADYGSFDATIVRLYSSAQVDRLHRLVPGIKHYSDEVREQREVAEAALTEADHRLVDARMLHNSFARLNPSLIADPDLAQAIRMSKAFENDRIARARKMGVRVGRGKDPSDLFVKRYPVISPNQHYYASRLPEADVVLYINSKYASIAAEALSEALDFDINSDEALDALAS